MIADLKRPWIDRKPLFDRIVGVRGDSTGQGDMPMEFLQTISCLGRCRTIQDFPHFSGQTRPGYTASVGREPPPLRGHDGQWRRPCSLTYKTLLTPAEGAATSLRVPGRSYGASQHPWPTGQWLPDVARTAATLRRHAGPPEPYTLVLQSNSGKRANSFFILDQKHGFRTPESRLGLCRRFVLMQFFGNARGDKHLKEVPFWSSL